MKKPSTIFSGEPASLRWAAYIYATHILFQGKIALSELGAFWTIFFLGYAIAKGYARASFHILYYPLAMYGLASTISALAAGRRVHHAFEAMLWFKMMIFPAAIILFRRLPPMREIAMKAQIWFAVGVSCWGLYEFAFLDRRTLEHRINGPVTHVMTFSGVLLPLALMLLLLWWHRRKWYYAVATIIVSTTLLLTFTRGVWLGWAAAVFTILVLTRPRWLAWAAPLAILFVTFMPLDLFGRLVSVFDTRQSSNFDRIRMLEAGVEMIRDHPVLGVGPANVKEEYALFKKHDAPRPRPPHLHNNVVQLWAERGVLGLFSYLLLLALFLRECAKSWRDPGEGRMWAEIGVAVTVGLTIAGLFEFNFGDTEVFYVLLDLFALICASLEVERARLLSPTKPMLVPTPGTPVPVPLPAAPRRGRRMKPH